MKGTPQCRLFYFGLQLVICTPLLSKRFHQDTLATRKLVRSLNRYIFTSRKVVFPLSPEPNPGQVSVVPLADPQTDRVRSNHDDNPAGAQSPGPKEMRVRGKIEKNSVNNFWRVQPLALMLPPGFAPGPCKPVTVSARTRLQSFIRGTCISPSHPPLGTGNRAHYFRHHHHKCNLRRALNMTKVLIHKELSLSRRGIAFAVRYTMRRLKSYYVIRGLLDLLGEVRRFLAGSAISCTYVLQGMHRVCAGRGIGTDCVASRDEISLRNLMCDMNFTAS